MANVPQALKPLATCGNSLHIEIRAAPRGLDVASLWADPLGSCRWRLRLRRGSGPTWNRKPSGSWPCGHARRSPHKDRPTLCPRAGHDRGGAYSRRAVISGDDCPLVRYQGVGIGIDATRTIRNRAGPRGRYSLDLAACWARQSDLDHSILVKWRATSGSFRGRPTAFGAGPPGV